MVCLPGTYFLGQFDLTKRFLNCLKVTWIPMIAQVGATLLHFVWCEIIVMRWGWDIVGLGVAHTITSLTLIIMVTVYAGLVDEIKEAITWPDAQMFLGWGEYFALGVPTTGILCAEYWAWQFLSIMSGNLSVMEQATMMISMQVAAMLNTTCLGVQEAACVLVGI